MARCPNGGAEMALPLNTSRWFLIYLTSRNTFRKNSIFFCFEDCKFFTIYIKVSMIIRIEKKCIGIQKPEG